MQVFANNALSFLAVGLAADAVEMTVAVADGAEFPAAGGGVFFKATLEDADGHIEIVTVTAHTAGGAVLGGLVRGQEGTTARAFAAGASVSLRVSAAAMHEAVNGRATRDYFFYQI